MHINVIPELFETETADRSPARVPLFGRDEIEVNFSSEKETACCGDVLKPFWVDDGRYMSVCNRCGQKYTDKGQVRYGGSPWIGVDLDGTLARDLTNKRRKDEIFFDEIGSPVEPMVMRLRKWIAEGKTVKIFTARASSAKQVALVKKWLASCGLPDLEVTNVKDMQMVELWDDRCVQVMTNLGEPVDKAGVLNADRQSSPRDLGARPKRYKLLSRLRIFLTL